MPMPICLQFERQVVARAFSRAWAKPGKRIAARMAMMAMTTSSSIRVKPGFRVGFMASLLSRMFRGPVHRPKPELLLRRRAQRRRGQERSRSHLWPGGMPPLGADGVRQRQLLMIRPPPGPRLLDPRPAGVGVGEDVVGAALVDRERDVDADVVPALDVRLVIRGAGVFV